MLHLPARREPFLIFVGAPAPDVDQHPVDLSPGIHPHDPARVLHPEPLLWTAHLAWISFALMIGAFALFMSALTRAGVDLSGQTGPLAELPAGVTGYVGWANRLIFAWSYLWAVLAALAVIRR